MAPAPTGRSHGHHRADLVTVSGQVSRPPLGSSYWPLTCRQAHVGSPLGYTSPQRSLCSEAFADYADVVTLTTITPNPVSLRALSHPVRVRALGLLRVEGPTTATALASRLGLNTGSTSYHLRQLALHGFIVEDTERGNGRERWWKAAHKSTLASLPAPTDASAGETYDAYLQAVAVVYVEMLQRSLEERPLLPSAWRQASTLSDWTVRVTPARARKVVDTLAKMLFSVDDEDDDEAEQFVFQLNAYPFPGHLGRDTPEGSEERE